MPDSAWWDKVREDRDAPRTASKRFLVKVQRPVSSNLPKGDWQILIYNRDRTVEVYWPANSRQAQTVLEEMGDQFKQFWHAHMEGADLYLDEIAPWQEW